MPQGSGAPDLPECQLVKQSISQVSYNLHDTEVFLYPSLALTRLKNNFPICKIFLGKQFLINNCKVYLNWRDLTPVATKSPVFVFSPFPLLPLPLFLPPLGFLLCLAAPPVLPPLEFVFLPFHLLLSILPGHA